MYIKKPSGPINFINNEAEIIHNGKLASFFVGDLTRGSSNEKVELFCKLVSEIDISKYNQKKFIEIVNAIFNEK